MIAWKQGEVDCFGVLIKLDIPEDAHVVMIGDSNGRTDKAWCDEITSLDGTEHFERCESIRDPDFIYEVGEMAYSNGFRFGPGNGPGIHFFMDKEKAMRY